MKKISLVLLFVFLCTLAQSKVLFVTGEWPPYVSQSLPNYGPSGELVIEICKAANIDYEIEFYPWARAENMVAIGQAFAAFPYAFNDERAQKYYFSDFIFYGVNVFFYHKENPKTPSDIKYNDLSDLKDYIIGGSAGSFYLDLFSEANLKVDMSNTNEAAFKKLLAFRVDLVPEEILVGYDTLKKIAPDKMENIGILSNNLGGGGNALIASKDYPNSKEILDKFNEGLRIIKENGLYDEILAKYNMMSFIP